MTRNMVSIQITIQQFCHIAFKNLAWFFDGNIEFQFVIHQISLVTCTKRKTTHCKQHTTIMIRS